MRMSQRWRKRFLNTTRLTELGALAQDHTGHGELKLMENSIDIHIFNNTLEKLDRIRAISNVKQALENLANQSNSVDSFSQLKRFTEHWITIADHELFKEIHGTI